MISNSSLPETRGTVNGLAQTLSALFRSVAPTFGSLTFAWSEENTDNGEHGKDCYQPAMADKECLNVIVGLISHYKTRNYKTNLNHHYFRS